LSNLENGSLQVRVLDAAGRAVAERAYSVEESLNTILMFEQQLSAGVYIVEMTNAGRATVERLIVK
jgi:methionine-rich copper-binding protein CopC